MRSLKDTYGRTFKILRVSLLSKCNFGCTYCTLGNETMKVANANEGTGMLEFQELVQLIKRLHQVLDLKTIRLTGGEPLLYGQLVDLIKELYGMGIPEIKLTTNGFLLARMAGSLKQAGLQSVNVSLDAMDEDVFLLMTRRRNLHQVLAGIDSAIDEGLKVKINTVIMRGINHHQLIPLLNYAFEKNIVIRFLELMGMGHLHGRSDGYLFTQQEMLEEISRQFSYNSIPRKPTATAGYWQTTAGQVFGIIANESEPFCSDCNRLRLDSNGNIYGCLSSNEPVALKKEDDDRALEWQLMKALGQKQPLKFSGSTLSMLQIGG